MDANPELIRRVPRRKPAAVAVDQWLKTVRLAADDGDHQGAEHAAGTKEPAQFDTEPNRQRILQWARVKISAR
jgi:hypothetical protein